VLEYIDRIKLLLIELDETVDLFRPVLVEDHLVPLFAKHSPYKTIKLYPTDSSHIWGMHISDSESGIAHIFYRRCASHGGEELEPSCPGCQHARYIAAKELVHTLDSDEQKTQPKNVAEKLLGQLLRGDWFDNHQVKADGMAGYWAIELLARYSHRLCVTGNFGTLSPMKSLISARESGDFSYIAKQYAIPQQLVQLAFADRYMASMRDIRKLAGIPLTVSEGS
jgi:hypothetical protein